MKSLRFILPLLIFVVLLVFLWVGLKLNPREVPSPLIGKPAPPFQLSRLDDPVKTVSQADLRGHAGKRVLGGALRDPDPILGHKERIGAPVPHPPIADRLIRRQGGHRGGVQRHEARLAELGSTDQQRGLVASEIGIVECDHLGAPQAGHHEEPK